MTRPYPKVIHGVYGHLSREEAWFLLEISDKLGPGIYAELGTCCGRSAILVAEGINKNNLTDTFVHTVDFFPGKDEKNKANASKETAISNIAIKGLDHLIRMHVGDSAKTAEEFEDHSVKFLFIDAAHDYNSVKRDYTAWERKIMPGGIVAFHDSNMEGVSRLLSEIGKPFNFVETIAWREMP